MEKKVIYKWFFIALVIKTLMFIYFILVYKWLGQVNFYTPIFFQIKELGGYIIPIENLIDKGTYFEIINGKILYANKMPGFVPIYGSLYAFFGRNIALSAIVILNVILDALTTLFLAIIGHKLTSSFKVFYGAFIFYALCGFVSFYSHFLLSEVITVFLVVASVYWALIAKEKNTIKFWVFSGLSILWAISIRPASILFLPFIPFIIFIKDKSFSLNKKQIVEFIKKGFVYITPFLLFMSFWIYRNYQVEKRFIPFATTIENNADAQTRELFRLIISLNGDIMPLPNTMRSWFIPKYSTWSEHKKFIKSNPFDKGMFTEKNNFDSLKSLRSEYLKTYDKNLSENEKEEQIKKFIRKSQLYIEDFKENGSFLYKIKSKILLLKNFIFVKQVYASPFNEKTIFCRANKAWFLLIYYIIFVGGAFGVIKAYIKTNTTLIYLSIFPIVHVGVHALVLSFIENRYLAVSIPFMTIFSAYFFFELKWIKPLFWEKVQRILLTLKIAIH